MLKNRIGIVGSGHTLLSSLLLLEMAHSCKSKDVTDLIVAGDNEGMKPLSLREAPVHEFHPKPPPIDFPECYIEPKSCSPRDYGQNKPRRKKFKRH